ncbi:MAG: addiction module protein [Pyrinomonadaceae bacterium]
MSTAFADIEKLAFSLSENERAKLADSLIASLPEDFIEDEEFEEALRRSREMDENPEASLTPEELDKMIRNEFPECV